MKRLAVLVCISVFISLLTAQEKIEAVAIFGTETIYTRVNQYENNENCILHYLIRVVTEVYHLKRFKVDGLKNLLQDNHLDEDDAILAIRKTNSKIKYAIFYNAKTNIITDFGYENILPAVEAEISLSVHNLQTNEVYYTVGSTGAIFTPISLSERNIIQASKEALRFLTSEKNPENCSVLLHSIFVNF